MSEDGDIRPRIAAGNNWCFVHSLDGEKGLCPEEEILNDPARLLLLFSEYVKNGADLLLAPTFNLNRLYLESYGAPEKMADLNRGILELAYSCTAGNIPLGAVLSQLPASLSPIDGALSFEALVALYKEQVSCLLSGPVDLFLLDSFTDVRHARAAFFAVRESKDLPVYVTFSVNGEGKTATDTDILSALVTMQSIGAKMFGVSGRLSPDELLFVARRLSEHAKIPLIALPDGIYEDELGVRHFLSPGEFSETAKGLLSLSVRLFGVSDRLSPDFVRSLSEAIRSTPFEKFSPSPDERDVVLAPTLRSINFVDVAEDVAEEIYCSEHMADDIIRAETGHGGILKIVLAEEEDLFYFEQSSYAVTLPLIISTDSAELLERAARIFPGCVLFDGTSDIDEQSLFRIREKYGLIIL